jgi:hypothetical protein
MDPLHATIEEFAAEGYTHVECFCPRCRVIRLKPMSRLPKISMGLTLDALARRLRCAEADAHEVDARMAALGRLLREIVATGRITLARAALAQRYDAVVPFPMRLGSIILVEIVAPAQMTMRVGTPPRSRVADVDASFHPGVPSPAPLWVGRRLSDLPA